MDSTTAIGIILTAIITLVTAYKGISSLITEPVNELKIVIQSLTDKLDSLQKLQEKTESNLTHISDKVSEHETRISILERKDIE